MTTKTATASEPAGPLIFPAMLAVMTDMEAIGKNQRNQQQGFNYRGIDQVYNALNPLLTKHGIFMTSEIVDKTREERVTAKGGVLAFTCLRMRYRFHAADGSQVATEVEGEGMDSGDKSSNKAMAVAHKYALLQAFCIPTEDMPDPDAEVHQVAPKASPATPPASQVQEETAEQKERRAAADRIRDAIASAQTVRSLDAIMKLHAETLEGFKTTFATAHRFLTESAVKKQEELKLKEGTVT